MSHGNPSPTKIAKILADIAEHIPIDAFPVLRITTTDVTKSGTAEPAAKIVIPAMV
jgi:hypothetical protein